MKTRNELLHEITRITEDHCEICPFKNQFTHANCLNCTYYKRLRKIGNDLIEITQKSRQKRGLTPPPTTTKDYKITKGVYKAYKKAGYSDKAIAKDVQISTATLVEFKRFYGLTK